MTKKLVYRDADGEKVTLPQLKSVERGEVFFKVEYRPTFSKYPKETNIRKDRVIRYDEP